MKNHIHHEWKAIEFKQTQSKHRARVLNEEHFGHSTEQMWVPNVYLWSYFWHTISLATGMGGRHLNQLGKCQF